MRIGIETLTTPFVPKRKDPGAISSESGRAEDGPTSHLGDWITLGKVQTLPAGQALVWAGVPLRCLYIVCSGAFKSTSCSVAGEAQILAFHLPGALIGFDGLETDRCLCDVESLVPSAVRALPVEQLLCDAQSAPGALGKLLRLVSHEMVRDRIHLAMMGRTNAMARLARFLRGLSEGLRRSRLDPDRITLPMSRTDLANYLGLAVETISRLFSRLHHDGVASVHRQRIHLLDHNALAEVCGEAMPRKPLSILHAEVPSPSDVCTRPLRSS